MPKALAQIFGKGASIHQKGNSALFQVAVKDGKKYFIKLAGGILVIRVGGGWDRLSSFLMNHSTVLGKGKKKATVDAQMAAIGSQVSKGHNLTMGLGSKYVHTKAGNKGSSGF